MLGVIPGRAKHEPGIHNHDREYGSPDVQLRIRSLCYAYPGMTDFRKSPLPQAANR
jgi:hypothetical protein